MKFVYWAFAAVMIVAAVLLALSNQEPIEIGIWPLPYLSIPAYVVLLGAFGIGFLCGGFMFWLRALIAKAREKSTGRRADRLQRELDTLQARDTGTQENIPKGTSIVPAAAAAEPSAKPSGTG